VDGSAEPTPKVGEVTSDEVTKAHGWSDIAVLSADTPTAAETSVAIRKTPTGVWYDNVDDQLRAVWRYPAELRALGIRGEVVVQFAVERNGAVRDVKVISSSGYPELDLAAVSAVPVRVAPLPPGVHGPQYVRETFLYGGTALAP
jgi:TonB family protein